MVSVGMLQWLATYFVHSAVLIGAVWLITKLVPRIPLAIQESLWKVALLGGILTASTQMAVGGASPWGELPLPRAIAGEQALPSAETTPPVEPSATASPERRVIAHQNGNLSITATRTSKVAPATIAAPAPEPAAPGPWRFVVLALIGAGSLFALGRLWLGARRLNAQLQGRRDVIEDPVLETFLQLCHKAELKKRPRLTASPHLRSPIALVKHEIVLPERAVDSLTAQQQEGMLAHEIAHLLRRDPLWQILAATIEAVFFFQPLNHLARRKIQEVAELQCDDWAARQAGTGVHLAKCLAQVATWVEDGPPPSVLATSMAQPSSPIVHRIKRLLHDGRKIGATHPVARMGLSLGTLGLVTWLAPGVAPAHAEPAVARAPVPDRVVTDPRVAIVDLEDDDHDRSRLRFETDDQILEVEVDGAHPTVPEPPVRDRSRVQIVIRGGMWANPFGCCNGWHGFVGIDVDGLLDDLFGDDDLDAFEHDLFGDVFAFSDAHDARVRALADAHDAHAQALARAREATARAREHAERAREHAQRARPRRVAPRAPARDGSNPFALLGGSAPPPPAASEIIEL